MPGDLGRQHGGRVIGAGGAVHRQRVGIADAQNLDVPLDSIYAWGLYDQELAAEGVSPEDFGIPRIAPSKQFPIQ